MSLCLVLEAGAEVEVPQIVLTISIRYSEYGGKINIPVNEYGTSREFRMDRPRPKLELIMSFFRAFLFCNY
jgi:hypothetical protein